jgi:hypothetical protein
VKRVYITYIVAADNAYNNFRLSAVTGNRQGTSDKFTSLLSDRMLHFACACIDCETRPRTESPAMSTSFHGAKNN